MSTQITTVEQLKELCIQEDGPIDCFIHLGLCRSSKSIFFDEDEGKFSIINEIDGSEDVLTPEELLDESLTNIGKAINSGRFYKY
jgi:hypothetical protein